MPVKDAEIAAQVKPGKTKTRSVPFAVGQRRYQPFLDQDTGPNHDRDHNPDDLGFRTLDRLRNAPTMVTALTLVKAPILRMMRQATIDCEDPSIKRVLEHQLLESGLWYDAMQQSLQALWAGFQASEKCWQVEDVDLTYEADDSDTGETLQGSAWKGPLLSIKELRDANPETVKSFKRRLPPPGSTATTDQGGKPLDGSFDGFFWNDGTQTEDVWVEPQNAFLYAHDREFGNLWGKPRTRPAYPAYFWSEFGWKQWMAWLAKKVVPPRIARFPEGDTLISESSGATLGNDEIAIDTADELDNTTVVAFPSTTDEHGKLLWDLEEKSVTDRTQVFTQTIQALRDEMLNAVFVPPRVFSQDQVGSFSSTSAFQDVFLLTVDALLFDVVQNGNKYLTKPLAVANFGTAIPKAEVVVPGLTDEEREQLAAVAQALLVNPDFLSRIDVDNVAKRRGIPLKAEEAAAANTGQPLPDGSVPALAGAAGAVPGAPTAPADATQTAPGAQNPPPAPPSGGAAPGNLLLAETSDSSASDDDASPGGVLALSDADVVALAEVIISLAQGFDASRWDVRPDPKAKSGYAVYDKHSINGQTGRRLTGFAADKVIESWKKAAGAAAKKSQAEQAKGARAAAAEAKRQSKAAETASRQSEREAIKQAKQLEREQKQAEAEAARTQRAQDAATHQAQSTILQQARTERSQMEITTARQTTAQVGQTLRNRGWDQASGNLGTREEGVQTATRLAAADPDHIYTVLRTKDGFLVVKKHKDKIVVPARSPNVAASDTGSGFNLALEEEESEPPSVDDLWQEAAERLREHMAPPEEDDGDEETEDDPDAPPDEGGAG